MAQPSLAFSNTERRVVRVLASYGVPVSVLAIAFDIAENSVRKHFRDELETAAVSRKADMVLALHRKAAKGNTPAIRLWFKLFGT